MEAHTYFLINGKEEMLGMEFIDDYKSLGDHGRPHRLSGKPFIEWYSNYHVNRYEIIDN